MTDEREIGTEDSRIIRYRSVIYDKKCLISSWTHIAESTKRQIFLMLGFWPFILPLCIYVKNLTSKWISCVVFR